MNRREYNRIVRIIDMLNMEGIDIVQISSNKDSCKLQSSQYSLKVTELLLKEKCNFRIEHSGNQHNWTISRT